jgi:signal transduction histidine kinase
MVPSNRQDEKDFVFNTIRKGEKINHLETKRLRKDGKILDISINYSPYFNHKDHVMGIFSIARDFTETFKQQRRYQDQLLKASQFKSEFMATMSHELRTPLNSIIGFSDIILEKYIYNVRSSADHLLNLVDDILDISSIEAGTVNLICENLNLNVFFNQITNMFRKQCASKKLSFEIIGLHEGMNLKCDPRRLKEIFINLLSNALKYTMEGGVKIEILEKSDQWIFSIIDTGIGIKEEDFKFIFQDFVRLKTEYTELIEGTGLGLSLTKRLIEIQNGVITFRSKWGEGSTFIFTLPKSS